MITNPLISSTPPALRSQNFGFLREEGIQYLQAIAGEVWTDYNLHDPGVTLLEALIYAMVELGYRQDQPIANLLASHPSGAIALEEHFHRAKYILTNCPYSPEDYRRFFIDIEGVHNIFLERALSLCPILYCRWEKRIQNKEKATKGKCEEECCPSLAFNRDIPADGFEIIDYAKVHLNGLYRFGVQLEEEVFDDINNPYIPWFGVTRGIATSHLDILGTTYRGIFQLPKFEDLNREIWGVPDAEIKKIKVIGRIKPTKESKTNNFEAKISVHFKGVRKVQRLPITFELHPIATQRKKRIAGRISASSTKLSKSKNTDQIINGILQNELIDFFTDRTINGFIPTFQQNIRLASQVLDKIKAAYCAKRNLCEEVEDIKVLLPQDVEVKVSIDLDTQAHPEETVAKALFAIDQYLNPSIRFYELQELLEKGMPVDEIYEGALLQHGFIKLEDICNFDRREVVYNSDLIRLIACQVGVEAVRDLIACSSIEGVEVITPEANCFELEKSGCYHFRLNLEENLKDDKICCFKGNVMVDLDMVLIRRKFNQLKNELPKRTKQEECLELPESDALASEHWHSVQYDLPRVYGIGADGLSSTHDTARHAKAKQLKGYLMLFEQFMANYLSQLSNVRDLFSMDANIYQSYFHQDLYELPNIAPLFKAFASSNISWSDFINDADNDYIHALEKASEDYSSFLQRRNRFLDHLLARVGEEVDDFENWARSNYSNDPDFMLEELIRVKQNLIKNYPDLSASRANALYYCKKQGGQPDVWDTANISGYLKRVCAKAGLVNCRRRSLCASVNLGDIFTIEQAVIQGSTLFTFSLKNQAGDDLLYTKAYFPTTEELEEYLYTLVEYGIYQENFKIESISSTKCRFYLINPDDTNAIFGESPPLDSKEEAKALRDEIISLLRHSFNREGIHLIEHILLRPQNRNYQLLCPFLCSQERTKAKRYMHDPYSFVMTLVLPSGYERDFSDPDAEAEPMDWFPHFRDLGYRQMLESVLRKEAPAHIYLNIFWLDCDISNNTSDYLSLNHFESLYQKWLEELYLDEETRMETNDALVGFLNALLPTKKCQKPKGCEGSEDEDGNHVHHIVFNIDESGSFRGQKDNVKEALLGFIEP